MGSADEFDDFVTARMDRWRRSAYLMCDDWHTADDIVSVTVAKVYRNWRTIRRADNPDAYAQKVLTRAWLDERRRPWRRERPRAEPIDLAVEAVEAVDGVVDRDSLGRLLRTLGPKQRAVVVLRFYLDCSVEETADILRVSEGTVKSQSARALESLRARAESARSAREDSR